MIDLLGEYQHKIDAKGRLSLPAKFRRVLPENLVVTVEPRGRCLYVFEPEDFSAWVESFFASEGGYNPRSKTHADLRTALRAGAMDATIDGAGRVNLSPLQRAAVGLEKDVVLIGNAGYFEIWDAKRWEEQKASIDLAAMLFD